MKKRNFLTSLIACSLLLGGGLVLASCGSGEEPGGTEPATQYVVTFNLNYDGAPAATTQKVNAGAKAQKPANPSRNGYSFVNWYENAAGTGNAFDFNTPINANKTLYAKWDQNQATTQYTVTFNLNYTGSPAATTAKVDAGGKVTKPTNPTRTGFSFDNWYENAAGTGSAFDFNTAINADKTLYAKWTENGDGGGDTPSGGTKSGVLVGDASVVNDQHKGTTEEDAAWTRYTLPLRSTNVSQAPFAPYFTCTITGSQPSEDTNGDGDGFYGLGGFRTATDAKLTWTFTSASACKAGLYFEMAQRTDEAFLGTLFSVAYGSANTPVDVSTVQLPMAPEGGTNNAPSNMYTFIAYINLVAGTNTVVVTRNATSPTGGAYNWWGMRLTTQSSAITAATA